MEWEADSPTPVGPELSLVLTEWRKPHSVHLEIIRNPPRGVRYVLKDLHWGAPIWGNRVLDLLYWKARGLRHRVLGSPDRVVVPDWGAPVHATTPITKSPRPWVVSFEHPAVYTDLEYDRLTRPSVRARVARILSQRNCRVVLPWTEAAAKATIAYLPEVAEKVRVLRPAVPPRDVAEPEDPEAPLVLFVGRFFGRKGGREAVEAFAAAREERCPRARMLVVSNAPADVVARYRDCGVEFRPPTVPREELLKTGFRRASVYLMPTHYDTFGMVFLEAFAHGLPVVASDTFAADEIVEHGEDGFIVPGYSVKWFRPDGTTTPGVTSWETLRDRQPRSERPRIVRDLARHLGDLLEDPALARRMGARGREKVTKGRFSIGERNALLRAVYDEAFGASTSTRF